MTRKILVALVLFAACTLVVPIADAQRIEEEVFYVYCEYQCNYDNGTWRCKEEDRSRCCFICIEEPESCGEGAISTCQECPGSGEPGF